MIDCQVGYDGKAFIEKLYKTICNICSDIDSSDQCRVRWWRIYRHLNREWCNYLYATLLFATI